MQGKGCAQVSRVPKCLAQLTSSLHQRRALAAHPHHHCHPHLPRRSGGYPVISLCFLIRRAVTPTAIVSKHLEQDTYSIEQRSDSSRQLELAYIRRQDHDSPSRLRRGLGLGLRFAPSFRHSLGDTSIKRPWTAYRDWRSSCHWNSCRRFGIGHEGVRLGRVRFDAFGSLGGVIVFDSGLELACARIFCLRVRAVSFI